MSGTGPSRGYAGKTAEQRRAERRERFLSAGLELLTGGGYAAATVERICETAGLSTRQFYAEFDNRDDVLLALYDQVDARAEAAVARALDRRPADRADFREMLRRALAAYLAVVARAPRRAQVAFDAIAGVNPRVEAHRRAARRRWAERLAERAALAAELGIIPDRDFGLLMTAFIGAVNGLVGDWAAAEPRAPLEEVAETLAHLLHSALTAE
ncbi:TetR/AcrR family transcriptional regulator [Spirillospora sp. CA-253888]